MADGRPGGGRPTLLLLTALLLLGCARSPSKPALPLRIGLLGDSQITSPNATPNCLYRNRLLDRRFPHAIRPPALEYLAGELLQAALGRLPPDVDVVLYLGDGANSGGTDEVQTLFQALGDYREQSKVPVFVVIGNHDYLGAGNTPDPVARFLLLNHLRPHDPQPLSTAYNRPLSKYEVLQRISSFNHESNEAPTNGMFRYTDNRDMLDPDLDHNSGLYLAGRLVYPKNGDKEVEIFLADTSDYADTWFKPELEMVTPFVPKWDFYGLQGSISSQDGEAESSPKRLSQITYFKETAGPAPPEFRFIASHFHPDNLDRKRDDTPEDWGFELVNVLHGLWEIVAGTFFGHPYTNQYLKHWLSDGMGNYWLSAHTHRETMTSASQDKVHVGGILEVLSDASFRSVNVGSTTDYRAHIAVVEPFSKHETDNGGRVKKVDEYVQVREIPLLDTEELSEKQHLLNVLHHLGAYGHANKNAIHCIGYEDDTQFGISLLGLNKDYQNEKWTQDDTEDSRERLDMFIDTFLREYPESKRPDVVRCLAFIASAYEADACNCRKGFDPDECRLR